MNGVALFSFFLNIKSLNLESTKNKGKITFKELHQENIEEIKTAFMLWAELSHKALNTPFHHQALDLGQCEQELKQEYKSVKG